ncbi:26S proteasome regulatory subunit [Fusarium falciforme]|uniref:26S proteasome regulatory subunit n=2 Tax=Fusarium solani species complex TaxID=232080 RepID=A0A9W8R4X6_9HYPO|nr:PCI domain-containing protein [Fusarium keratoplasticum]KAI8676411.1 PCI domain-containing protein [Fusarium sp. Ph1]KAJ4170933.1 26S proteasome regulatory subunit [Fusarium falciforme]KAI8670732.1 PCI domain-containing protein [Fusarium keratoplasticum]KAI8677964.1 PCI domain-containing protein [Fusarium keratoplasticum]KAJ4185007.1 26S proteasome regulatory subunit [Fusarium falciforme]
MSADAIPDFLAEQRDEAPEELQPLILDFENYWERKLWHQLTEALVEFFSHPGSAPKRLVFYRVFILKFADKINQLKLVELALKAATECDEDEERLEFLQSVAKKVDNENSQDAYVFALVAVARAKLDLEELDSARKDLDTAERILDSFDSVENIVHASFYDANATYYQLKMDFSNYYRTALLYLACIDVASLSPKERYKRAYHLSIAALVSTSIYNFGELLLHPILDVLAKSEHAWMRELLFAFNRGDLAAYERLSDRVESNKLLSSNSTHLRQKIYLSALTEAVFRRPPHDRTMTFATIAQETKVRPQEIEHLIMKALSLGLLRGTIDQVDGVAHITWVQPKVLDMKQIAAMRQRLLDWDSSVNQLGNWIESAGKDVWAA